MNEDFMKELRCPWCGRAAPPPAQVYFTTRECPCCGNRYGWSKESTIAEISGILVLLLNAYLLINGYINLFVFITVTAVIIIFYPSKFYVKSYRRVGDDFSKTVVYTVKLENDIPLKKNMIYPLCLGNENSESIFVCAENIKKKNGAVIAEMRTLPCVNVSQFSKECTVHIFQGEKEISNGILTAADGISFD